MIGASSIRSDTHHHECQIPTGVHLEILKKCVSYHYIFNVFHAVCSVSAEGAEAIADIVKRAHLKELNLYMNDIGDAGILKVHSLDCPCAVLLLSLDGVAHAVQRISQQAILKHMYLHAGLLDHLQTQRILVTHRAKGL